MAKKNQKQAPQKEEQIELDVALNKSGAFIEKNWKKLGAALLAIIVACAGFYGYQHYAAGKEAKAQAAVSGAQTAFATQQFEQALNGDGQVVGFLKIIKEYSGTKTANLAKLYAAICYANTNKIDEAIKMFEDFDQKDDKMVSPASIAALANCYVQKGDTQKGLDLLLKAAKTADNEALSPVFLLQAGQLYESLNQNDKAVEIYNKIKKEYYRSGVTNEMDKYIERATK